MPIAYKRNFSNPIKAKRNMSKAQKRAAQMPIRKLQWQKFQEAGTKAESEKAKQMTKKEKRKYYSHWIEAGIAASLMPEALKKKRKS